MRKIAYILTTFPCPSETFAVREIQTLRKMGLDITVFAASGFKSQLGDTEPESVFYRPGVFSIESFISMIYLIAKFPLSAVKFIILVFQFLKICPTEAFILIGNFHTVCFFLRVVEQYEISHIHAYFLSWPGCIGFVLSKLTNTSFSIAAHARDVFVERGAAELKVSHSQFVVCCSKQGLNYLKDHIAPRYHERLCLNYHGINLSSNNHLLDRYHSRSADTVLAAGRFVRKKGFEHLLKAFARVVQSKPERKLIIAGLGPEKENLTSLIERLHLNRNVHLFGWLSHKDTLKLIRQASVLVVPSVVDDDGDRDGIPNVILEAFSLGTSVVASSLEGIAEVVKHEQTGLLVEPENIEQLALAIEKLLSDTSLNAHLSINAYKTVRKDFDADRNCCGLSKFFESIN